MSKLILNEDLFDNVVDVFVPEVEATITVPEHEVTSLETPTPGIDTGISNSIISAINDEWQTILNYNNLIANLTDYPDMICVIQDIVAEENTHIGQLQEMLRQLSPNVENISKGEIEGAEQLNSDLE